VFEARVSEALMGLHRVCADVRFLGSYPRADGARATVRPGTTDDDFAGAHRWLSGIADGGA
jgi:prephenate dehydratase